MKIVFILLFSFLIVYAYENTDESQGYVLGEGLQVGNLPVYVGGYFSVDYKHMEDYDHYRVDDLAFLSYGSKDRFSYMVELEYKEFYTKIYENDFSRVEKDTRLHTERLYIDYTVNDSWYIRAGKYNSSIGYWNLIPINVLRETSSSPITSYIIFPRFTTGLQTQYKHFNDESIVGIEVSVQHNDDIDSNYNNYEIDRHYGISLEYERDLWSLKFNGGYFHLKNPVFMQKDRSYALLSAKIEDENYQLMTEIGSQYGKNDFTTRYAAYVQGLYRFSEHHIGIIRYESYDNSLIDEQENKTVFGYTYRPLYPVAFKAEYQMNSQSDDNTFILSFSVLF